MQLKENRKRMEEKIDGGRGHKQVACKLVSQNFVPLESALIFAYGTLK